MSEALKVAVRCRPFNQREIDRDAKLVIDMVGATTIIRHPDSGEEKKFTFDYSYWSHDGFETDENGYMRPSNDKYADQTKVFNDLGVGLLNNAWNGFNCCVFAYGQTGSGKSYSIVGYGENKGIIPLTCSDLFRRIADTQTDQLNYRVQVTMLEIYNEKLRDLLNPKTAADQLKIRTSAAGMYVENIREVAVDSYESIEKQMDVGTKNRTVGATQMNATSSRAHTVFTINFTKIDTSGGAASELRAALNLVDLAGSERANSTGATGDRLKEGAAINQSLSNLGLVISALAEQANNPKKKVLVPYRASKLTLLLQNALGGNSKTVMVAALSPADINYEETLSTLRYADRAKQIKTVATIQENPTDKLIRELREENEKLKAAMGGGDLSSVLNPEFSGEAADAAKEAARVAEEEAKAARVAAEAAKEELAAAQARMQQLEALLGQSGVGVPMDTAAVAKADPEAAAAADKAAKLGSPAEQEAAESEMQRLTAGLEALAKEGGRDGPAVADATAALGLKLHRGEAGAVNFADAASVRDAILAELRAEGKVQGEQLSAQMQALVDKAAGQLGEAESRRAAAAAAGPNTSEIVALKIVFYQRVQAARREALEARSELNSRVAHEKNSLESADAARQTAEGALAELATVKALAEEQSKELGQLKVATAEEKEKLMSELQRKAEEAKALGDKAKAVDFTRQFNRVAERLKAEEKSKLMLKEQMEANERALANLELSWDSKLEAAKELEQKRQAVLDKLGLGRLEDGIDDKTPHLVNLNEDPNLNGQLLYFLKPSARTTVGSDPGNDVVLEGPGIAKRHATVDVGDDTNGNTVTITPLTGSTSFVNGAPLDGARVLEHSDRLILGARQVFRLVHPVDAARKKEAGAGGQGADLAGGVIDWGFAQQELGDALGKAINVKVDEEVARERKAMEDRLAKMSASLEEERKNATDKLEKERAALLDNLRAEEGGVHRAREQELARKEAELDAIKARAAKLEEMQAGLDGHVDAFRAELERVEEELRTLMPQVHEANVIADAMGRKVFLAARVYVEVPETAGLSPAQEMMLHKTVSLQVVLTTKGQEERQKRETVWTASEFLDRMFAIRDAHYAYLKLNESPEPGSDADPFHMPPKPVLIGRAYLALKPLTHRLRAQHWLTVLDPLGRPHGEVLCALQPTEEDFVTPAPPLLEPSLAGQPLNLVLRIQQARGLPEDQNNHVFCKYTLDMEERQTDVCHAKTSAPTFDFRDDLLFPVVTPDMVEYFRSDFLTIEVWGEPDTVAEGLVFEPPKTDAAKAAANPFDGAVLPPEVFDFFVSLDIHENTTVERSESYAACQYDGGTNPWGITKGVYTLSRGRARRLLIKLSQGQAQKYPVERCIRVWISKVEDVNGSVVDERQVPLSVLSTASLPDGTSATIVANWFSGPSVLDELTPEGNVFTVTLTIEVELQNLELAAPVKLTKKAALRIEEGNEAGGRNASKASSQAAAPAKKRFSLFGGGGSSAAEKKVLPGEEEKKSSLDPSKRAEMLRRQDTHHPVFMGSWERTDEAVVAQREDMLRVMNKEFDSETDAKSVVQQLHEGLQRLQEALQAEEQKQMSAFEVNLQSARRLAGAAGVPAG